MIYFILGIITGILIGIASVSFSYKNMPRTNKILDRGYPLPKDFKKEKVIFIEPQTDAEDAQDEVFEENKKKGRDTNLEEII